MYRIPALFRDLYRIVGKCIVAALMLGDVEPAEKVLQTEYKHFKNPSRCGADLLAIFKALPRICSRDQNETN